MSDTKKGVLLACIILIACILVSCKYPVSSEENKKPSNEGMQSSSNALPKESRLYEKVEEEDSDSWIYLSSNYYKNENLGISITFPASWVDEIIIVEVDTAVIVYFKQALEQEPKLGSMAILFSFLPIDKTDESVIKDLKDNPSASLFAEKGDTLYFITKRYGSIEMYFSDIWAENYELLDEMGKMIEDNMHEMIEFLN